MNNPLRRASAATESAHLFGLVAAVVVIGTLYFARVVFVPLALALLVSMVLAAPVAFLEKLRMPRSIAIFLVVAVLVGFMGVIGWKTSQQFVDLTDQLPSYRKTLEEKIRSLKGPSTLSLNKASDTVKELSKEINAVTPGATPAVSDPKKDSGPGSTPSRPLAVQLVPPANPLESIQNVAGPVGTAGIVILFAAFILASREDLRDRLIRLMGGGGRLNIMTQALDEATQRINRYLFLQLLVNSGYGVVIFTGLHFIGIPNAALWGLAAAVLRFLPYVGAPLAALMPILLSLAVFPGWRHAAVTAGLFVVLELIVANILEPLLYGAQLGLGPLAILVAAVFWTLIWGFPGLVLSTPLTVCLVVMGRYIPSLGFLSVLLGDEPVLPPHSQYYQRLLGTDQNGARQVLEQQLKDKNLEELYSTVLIPALGLAEQDRHRNDLDEETVNFIYQSTREIVEELGEDISEQDAKGEGIEISGAKWSREAGEEVLCIPARDQADDVVAMALAQLLERRGRRAQSIPIGTTAEMVSQVAELKPAFVCISALPPFAVDHARALYAKLRAQSPDLHIAVCLWQFEGDPQKAAIRLKLMKGDGFFTTLPQVLQHLAFRTVETAVAAKEQSVG